MRIGLLSDTHDNLENIAAAVEIFRREGVTTLLHAGDICGPAVVDKLADFQVTFAQGNMDNARDLRLAVEARQGAGRLAHWHRLVIDGWSIALLHGDMEEFLNRLILSGDYAYVIYGHSHRHADRQVGQTRAINPGALGGARHQPRSVCILDLETGQARFFEIER